MSVPGLFIYTEVINVEQELDLVSLIDDRRKAPIGVPDRRVVG